MDCSLPWSFWHFVSKFCPSLKVIRSPTNEYPIPTHIVMYLSLDTASFIDREHFRTSCVHGTLSSTLSVGCRRFGRTTRVEMDCPEFTPFKSRPFYGGYGEGEDRREPLLITASKNVAGVAISTDEGGDLPGIRKDAKTDTPTMHFLQGPCPRLSRRMRNDRRRLRGTWALPVSGL